MLRFHRRQCMRRYFSVWMNSSLVYLNLMICCISLIVGMLVLFSLVLAASRMQLSVMRSRNCLRSFSFKANRLLIHCDSLEPWLRFSKSSFLFLSSHVSKNKLAIWDVCNFRKSLTPFSRILITAISLILWTNSCSSEVNSSWSTSSTPPNELSSQREPISDP